MKPDESENPAEPDHPQPLDRSARRVQAASDALRTTIRDMVERSYNPEDLPAEPVPLELAITVDPSDGFSVTFSPPIHKQVYAQFDEITAETGVMVPGHVYCFRCRTATCEHSQPPAPLHVFAGYASTGFPEWKEFAQVLIDQKDERVDRLYQRKPGVLARVELGKQLKSEQLRSFGRTSKSYSLLGQVVAGYFTPRRSRKTNGGDSARWAMTFQVVEVRRARNQPGLALNVLCRLPDGESLDDFYGEGGGEWILRSQRHAERSLSKLERQILDRADKGPAGYRSIMRRVPGVLNQLSTSLERGYFQSKRRTAHSDERRKQQRPVHRAVADARAAADDDLLHDEKTRAVVVRGQHGRFHVFTLDAKHVTSFKSGPDTVDHRVRTRRWRPLTDNERDDWRSRLQATLKSDE